MSRYNRKVDANQAAIVSALEQVGCRVLDLSAVGGGAPDLLICTGSVLWLCEIKNADGRNKIEFSQEQFRKEWPVYVDRSVEEAIEARNRAVRGKR